MTLFQNKDIEKTLKALLKKGDIIIIAGILLVAAILAIIPLVKNSKIMATAGMVAVIVENGETVDRIDLKRVEEPYEYKLNGGVLLVESDGITYIEAECPDQRCIKMGKLKKIGDTAACVPNKTCVYIESRNEEEVEIDAITY